MFNSHMCIRTFKPRASSTFITKRENAMGLNKRFIYQASLCICADAPAYRDNDRAGVCSIDRQLRLRPV